MSRISNQNTAKISRHAAVFAALGDETRLSLVAQLATGKPLSISQLTEGSKLTRQAITKHLKVLESVGVVLSTPSGRESLFALSPRPFKNIQEYLTFVSEQWDVTLARLKAFVEK